MQDLPSQLPSQSQRITDLTGPTILTKCTGPSKRPVLLVVDFFPMLGIRSGYTVEFEHLWPQKVIRDALFVATRLTSSLVDIASAHDDT